MNFQDKRDLEADSYFCVDLMDRYYHSLTWSRNQVYPETKYINMKYLYIQNQ